MARRYGINRQVPVGCGGAVVKEFLLSKNVDLTKFVSYHKNPPETRRRLVRGKGGEVTVPVTQTNGKLKKEIRERIQSGEFVLGELIVPRRFKKTVIDKTGNVREEEFVVHGRKIPLLTLRKNVLQQQEKLGLIRFRQEEEYDQMSDDALKARLEEVHEHRAARTMTADQQRNYLKKIERTRHILVWGDHSSILNHGYLLYMVTTVYDEAFYISDEEAAAKGLKMSEVQAEVEKPHIHIMARTAGSDTEQLAYVDTRNECIRTINVPLESSTGIPITDVMRFFSGDNPERQFETGEQRGGRQGCSGCAGTSKRYYDLTYAFHASLRSLEDRQTIVLGGHFGRSKRNGGIRPFDKMLVSELKIELRSRGIEPTGLKKDMESDLREILGGVQRVPALLWREQRGSLTDMNLGSYEVIPGEALHDIKGHIHNLLQELKFHLKQEERKLFEDAYQAAIGDKDALRGSDLRLGLILITLSLHGKVEPRITELLLLLAEISHLMYLPSKHRSPKVILRMYNITFKHAVLCYQVVKSPKNLSFDKFYGQYYHALSTHAPQIMRVVAPSSTDAEEQERTFNSIKGICKATSSSRATQVIDNVLVHLQAEISARSGERSHAQRQESTISKSAKALPERANTLFSAGFIYKYSDAYQSHLERIADYIKAGSWHEVNDNGVMFFDGPKEPDFREEGPFMAHFRSASLFQEAKKQKEIWQLLIEEALNGKAILPHPCIKVFDGNGDRVDTIVQSFWDAPDDIEQDTVETHHNTEQEEEGEEELDWIEPAKIQEFPQDLIQQEQLVTDDGDGCPSETRKVEANSEINSGNDVISEMNVNVVDHIESTSVSEKSNKKEKDHRDTEKGNEDTSQEDKVQCSSKPREVMPENGPKTYQTSLVRAISTVLTQYEEDLNELDKARIIWKRDPESRNKEGQFKKQLAVVSTHLLKQYTCLKEANNSWEKAFYLKRNKEANIKDLQNDKDAYSNYKKMKKVDSLLQLCQVTVHQ